MAEDATLNTQVIMRRMAYGVISEATYFNRRYEAGGASLVASSHFRPEYYNELLEHAEQRILNDAIEMHGQVPMYVQAVVLYNLMFRFRGDVSMLNAEQLDAYKSRMRRLLEQVSVKTIALHPTTVEQRINMLNLRSGNALTSKLSYYDGVYSYDGVRIYSLNYRKRVGHRAASAEVQAFAVQGESLEMRGTIRSIDISSDVSYEVLIGDRSYPLELGAAIQPGTEFLSNEVRRGLSFSLKAEFRRNEKMRFVANVANGVDVDSFRLPLIFGKHAGFAGDKNSLAFRHSGSDVFRQENATLLRRRKLSGKGADLKAEIGFLRRLDGGTKNARVWARRLSAVRLRASSPGNIWLLADHKSEAGDNAEALFRHICAHPELGIHAVMSLSKSAPQYAALSALGEVVEPGSTKYFRRYFQASTVLNSSADDFMVQPLAGDLKYFADLVPPVSVFLQHGVILHDLSGWLNWAKKGFDVFVTSAEAERTSILNGSYAYGEDSLALVGLSRFDRLNDRPERQIVVAPTWRKALVGDLDPQVGRNGARDDFEESAYFRMWQSVLADQRLLRGLKEFNYRLTFALHPSHSAETDKFKGGEAVTIAPHPLDYRELLETSAVLVTDYSSVAFDFAYMRKPVAYLQNDRDDFYASHAHQLGYFSFERDGFGPVAETTSELVDHLLKLMADGADMAPTYRERADGFFTYSGGGNSARLIDFLKRREAGELSS